METDIVPYNDFMNVLRGTNIFHYLKGLDREKLQPFLLINEFTKDWKFLRKLSNSAKEEFKSIDSSFNEIVDKFHLPTSIFETNKYYDSNLDRYYLPFWKNENALTDIIVSGIINSECLWQKFYSRIFNLTNSNICPDTKYLSVKREKAIRQKADDSENDGSNGKKGRSDIFLSYVSAEGRPESIHLEHKINHDLSPDQVELYCQSAEEYENSFFVLLTCKDKDINLLDENGKKLHKKIQKSYLSEPIIINHVDMMRIFFNSKIVDAQFHYEWVITWLFEIVKNYRNENLIKSTINKPLPRENGSNVWEQQLFLNIVEEE